MVAPAAFVYRIPEPIADLQAAPLLCAGAIGLRSLELTSLTDGESLGLTGFGASGHLVLTMARERYPRSRVLVFARSESERALALERGAVWAGHTDDESPEPLAAIIDTLATPGSERNPLRPANTRDPLRDQRKGVSIPRLHEDDAMRAGGMLFTLPDEDLTSVQALGHRFETRWLVVLDERGRYPEALLGNDSSGCLDDEPVAIGDPEQPAWLFRLARTCSG